MDKVRLQLKHRLGLRAKPVRMNAWAVSVAGAQVTWNDALVVAKVNVWRPPAGIWWA